jgi:hypothetical protein
MGMKADAGVRAVLEALDAWGIVLAQDAKLPSVTTIVAGEAVRGSWWGHRANRAIYETFGALERRGTFSARLVAKKWAYVHPRLVPAVHAMAASGEPWQTRGLSRDARGLLAALGRTKEIDLDEHDPPRRKALAKAATDLESRLLADSRQVHTASGHHTRVLSAWRVPRDVRRLEAAEARAALDAAGAGLHAAHGASVAFPWGRA